MTSEFMWGLLAILLTFFCAKLSDPHLIFLDFLKLSGMRCAQSCFPCLRERIRMAPGGSKWQRVKRSFSHCGICKKGNEYIAV